MPVPIPSGAQIGEQQQAGVPIPQGAQVGQPEDNSAEEAITNLPVTVAQEGGEMLKGAGQMLAAPAMHMKNAFSSLASGNLAEAGQHFLKSVHAAEGGEIADSIFQSSKQAKDRMMESAKKGDSLGVAQHAAGIVPGASQVDDAMTKFQENPDTKGLVHVIATALPMLFPGMSKLAGKVSKAGEAGEVSEAATAKPGVVKQVVKGKSVEQEPAQAALREAAGSGEPSLRESLTKPIAESEAKADALYKQIDESGVDVKAMNRKLQNTNRQLKTLTDTPEDQAMEAKLEQSRTGLMDKIKESGVDPKLIKQADAQFRQSRALADVEAKIFKNPEIVEGNSKFGTEETVNVDKAIKALEKLESSKYGARVEQAFGKEGANELKSKLYAAQRQGVHALKMQQVAKWVAGIVGAGTVAKGVGLLGGEK